MIRLSNCGSSNHSIWSYNILNNIATLKTSFDRIFFSNYRKKVANVICSGRVVGAKV